MINRIEKTRKIKNFFKNGVFFLKGVLILAKFCLNLNRRNLLLLKLNDIRLYRIETIKVSYFVM